MFMSSGYSAHTHKRRLAGAVPSGIEHHHAAADVILGGGHLEHAGRAQPRRDALAFKRSRGHALELDQRALAGELRTGARAIGLALPVRVEDHALALDHDAAA